jgi:hypothetical protein
VGISIDIKTSGLKNWAKSPRREKIDEARTGVNEGGVITAADVDQGKKTPDCQPHRPWLVPGVGKL